MPPVAVDENIYFHTLTPILVLSILKSFDNLIGGKGIWLY